MTVVDKLAVHRNDRRLQTCKTPRLGLPAAGVILVMLKQPTHPLKEKEERPSKNPPVSQLQRARRRADRYSARPLRHQHCRVDRAGARCGFCTGLVEFS